MTIGQKERFAIKVSVDSEHLGDSCGRLAYVLAGHVVGDYAVGGNPLATLATVIQRISMRTGQRFDEELLALDGDHLYQRIHHALYVDDERADVQVQSDAARFGRFIVGSVPYVLDGWHCFLVEGNGIGRFVYKGPRQTCPTEVQLREGEFDAVCREFVQFAQETGILPKTGGPLGDEVR